MLGSGALLGTSAAFSRSWRRPRLRGPTMLPSIFRTSLSRVFPLALSRSPPHLAPSLRPRRSPHAAHQCQQPALPSRPSAPLPRPPPSGRGAAPRARRSSRHASTRTPRSPRCACWHCPSRGTGGRPASAAPRSRRALICAYSGREEAQRREMLRGRERGEGQEAEGGRARGSGRIWGMKFNAAGDQPDGAADTD